MDAVLQALLAGSDNIVFFGGAGVSTESGLPDFRSADGLYQQPYDLPPETLLSHSYFMADPAGFFRFYRDKLLRLDVQPNPAHRTLAALEQTGRLKAVITQNIDGLHQAAGSREVLELHGSIHRNHCLDCGRRYDARFVAEAPELVPRCPRCGGVIKPDVVLYEEPLDAEALSRALAYLAAADVVIVGGTSLGVYPAAGLLDAYIGDKLVVINRSSTPADARANYRYFDPIGEVLG